MRLSIDTPKNCFSEQIRLNAYSRGMGAIGLPGDLSSMSRFVRVAFTKMNSLSENDEKSSVSQFFHILGSVEQQRGCCRLADGKYEISIYTSCCNADRGIYYYKTYDNYSIVGVDMNREDLNGEALISYKPVSYTHLLRSDKFMNMNAVGIDVSKGKSTVTIRRPGDIVLMPPCDIPHTQSAINGLINEIKALDGETKVCMEHTGRYYEPIATWLTNAGIFVSAVNPILIRDFGDDSLRTPKTDKADSKKIARYTLDRWTKLKQYGNMDKTRNQLKTMNRQFGFYMAQKTAMKNNLISILDQTYPGANDFFDSPARSDGSQKWVDFVHTYWHVECVRGKSLNAFTEHYQNWCRRKGYNFSAEKAAKVYCLSSDLIAVFPKDDNTKMLVRQAVAMLNVSSETVESLRQEMNKLASTLPEYPVVMAMNGVGTSLGPQLIAEIGDVTRFTHREALTAFAGVDPGKNDSGQHIQKSVRTSKKGSPSLRKALFQIMDSLIKRSPADDPVYAFMDKKRKQGKPYYVYMTAGANKFLRIYYGRVKEYLSSLPEAEEL